MNSWDERRNRKARLLMPDLSDYNSGTWADIGSGDGVFTRLILEQLEPGSHLIAVDQNRRSLRQLRRSLPQQRAVTVETIVSDFTRPLSLPSLDGLLIANAIHYTPRHETVLQSLVGLLSPAGCLILIEYNSSRSNSAVPYPLPAQEALRLFSNVGLIDGKIVCRQPSSFMNELVTIVGRRG